MKILQGKVALVPGMAVYGGSKMTPKYMVDISERGSDELGRHLSVNGGATN